MPQKIHHAPISDQQTYLSTLDYIAAKSQELVKKILRRELQPDTLTVFTHYPAEHAFLDKLVRTYGSAAKVSHGATLYINSDLEVREYHIKLLGVRAPDSSRPQVGYADFPVDDYDNILAIRCQFIQEITSGTGRKLLELRHPDFDVLGYIVRAEDHETPT